MKSALFVDFDNVYSQLRQLQPDAAERFARHPSEWIGWLTGSLALPEPHEEGQRRRLLVRRCYLNPNWYQTYRHAFLRAGFEIVDCPPVTSQGKTSTDIHMVLDVIDLLQHETRYDEFIVFSADADFTPVLRKLRRYDRRTTVLAIGFPSAAYQASADLLIDERHFIQDALGLGRTPSEGGAAINGAAAETLSGRGADGRPFAADAQTAPVPCATPKSEVAARGSARPATPDELSAIAARIWGAVEESSVPVSAGQLASRLKQEYPDVLENWNGSGTFKQFFRSLGLSRLAWMSGPGGLVLDPSRHDVEGSALTDEPDSPWAGREGLFDVVKEVCSLTGAPMFAPKDLHVVLALLADELEKHGFELSTTARLLCSKCLEVEGLRVRLRDVTFLLRGMQLNGHVFGQGHDDLVTLATRLVNQVLFLCEREQMVLNETAISHIKQWIAGDAAA
ncbi:MAG: NYN domain-containing protein [Burkholderiaceae bacterium]